ncbi:MAG: condensation domain-containing protein [Candidatus Lokiarchaeota archaeon]
MERKLNDLEYFNFSIGQPYNLVVVLSIKGPILIDELKLALKKTQEKHPLLRVRIQGDNEDFYWFTSKDVGEIPIETLEFENESKTTKLFLKNLETPFDISDPVKPLFRVTLLHSLERSDLILCAQHTITDGLSMAFLMRDISGFLNDPDIEISPINSPMNKEDIFPSKIRKKIPKSAFRAKFFLFLFKIYYFLRHGKRKEHLHYASDYKEDDLRLISWNLSNEETDLFIHRCKKRRVSVHSAICTAFLPDISIINNPVNLRGRLNYPIGEAFGLYAGAAIVKMKYKDKYDFWENVKRYQKKLRLSLRDKSVYKIFKIVHTGVSLSVLKDLAPLFFEIVVPQEAFAITNLGSLDRLGIDLDSKKFLIESFYGAISFAMGAITVLVYTMRGKMYFNFHYLESRHNAQRMNSMVLNSKNRILDSI